MLYAIIFNVATGATLVTPHASFEACSAAMFAGIARGMERGEQIQGNCLPAAETVAKLASTCVDITRDANGDVHAVCYKL